MAIDTLVSMAGPVALTSIPATVYTVPAATTATVRAIHVCNESSSPTSLTISRGADGAGARFAYQLPIPANGTYDWTGNVILATGEVVQAYGTGLTLTAMSGVQTA